jgi:uncharacterized membrane protein
MMKNKNWLILIGIIMASILGTFIIYPNLPTLIPTHFNVAGEVDQMGAKWTVFITMLLPLIILGLMVFLPKIDPRKRSYDKFKKAYAVSAFILTLFIVGIHWMVIAYALGYTLYIPTVMKLVMGLLLVLIGNYLPQVRQNYFYGIKTPWTLADETT